MCTKARVFRDDELEVLALRIGTELSLSGAYCIQVLTSTDGGWVVTDINPRTGAGTPLSAAVGFDLGAASLAEGIDIDPSNFLKLADREQFVVRTYEEWVM